MAAKRSGGKKAARKSRRKSSPRKKASARKRLVVRTEKRGLEGDQILLALGEAEVAPLVTQVKAAGGVRSLDRLLEVRAIGVTRAGATRTAEILDECKKRLTAES